MPTCTCSCTMASCRCCPGGDQAWALTCALVSSTVAARRSRPAPCWARVASGWRTASCAKVKCCPTSLGTVARCSPACSGRPGRCPCCWPRCSAPSQHQRLAGGGRAAVAGGGGGYAGQPQPWPAAGPACVAPACAEALAAGVLLCASSPACGGPVYPANYPGVIRVTGDARCAPGQWSWLGSRQADFGGYVGTGDRAGASLGCAALSGRIAALLREAPGMDCQQVHDWLRHHAAFAGPERRGAGHG